MDEKLCKILNHLWFLVHMMAGIRFRYQHSSAAPSALATEKTGLPRTPGIGEPKLQRAFHPALSNGWQARGLVTPNLR